MQVVDRAPDRNENGFARVAALQLTDIMHLTCTLSMNTKSQLCA